MVRSDEADVELKTMHKFTDLYDQKIKRYNVERQDADMDEVQLLDEDHEIMVGIISSV